MEEVPMRRSLLFALLALALLGCPQPADKPPEEKPPAKKPPEEKPPAKKPPAPPEKKTSDLEQKMTGVIVAPHLLRSETAYRESLDQAAKSEAVKRIIGTPIKAGDVVGKKRQHKGHYGLVLEIKVSGPNGTGTLHVHEDHNIDLAMHKLSARFVAAGGKEVGLPGLDRYAKDRENDKKKR
jgi:hypothetical protein